MSIKARLLRSPAPSQSSPWPDLFDPTLLRERPQDRQHLFADRLAHGHIGSVEALRLNYPNGDLIRRHQRPGCLSERVRAKPRQLVAGEVACPPRIGPLRLDRLR